MAANTEILRISMAGKITRNLTLRRKEDDLVIVYDSKLKKASLTKRRCLKTAAEDNFIGRAGDTNAVFSIRDRRGIECDQIKFSDLGWYARRQRRRGRCNDVSSPKALIEKEEKCQQLKDEKPQQHQEDLQEDLDTQLKSQVSSCSSKGPPPPYNALGSVVTGTLS